MPFFVDPELKTSDVKGKYGEYLKSFSSSEGQVRADLFSQAGNLLAYYGWEKGYDEHNCSDAWIRVLTDEASRIGHKGKVQLIQISEPLNPGNSWAVQKERIKRTASMLDQTGIDALLLAPGADMYYLTGFEHGHAGERLLAFVLRRDGSTTWIAPTMNVAQLQMHGLPDAPIRAWGDAETYSPALRETLANTATVAFDDEARSAFLFDLNDSVPAARAVKASTVMRGLRSRKEESELASLRAAALQVDKAIPEAIALCIWTRQESRVEKALHQLLGGSEKVAFSIVASGRNSALPHHETGKKPLARGDVVILDFGTRFEHYHSDITVTCSVGEPSDPEVRKVYRVVWEAQQKALEAIRPGVTCESIDRAARNHITAAGYGDFFLHRTGHGLGLQIHEPPYLVAGNTEPLEEGMVFSIEPGIYLPDRFGVRLEVIASVGANGVELINRPSAPELPIAELA